MGVISNLIVAPREAAEEIRVTDAPGDWECFCFAGMDNVNLSTLLSLLSSGSPASDYEKWNDDLESLNDEGPFIFAFSKNALKELTKIAALESSAFDALAAEWHATDELRDWSTSDVSELLRGIGDIAQSASEQGASLFLWMSLNY
jgi:hypothetical protein